MTHFKVSDEALDVALRASFVKACELEGKPFDEDEYQGRKSKADNSARQQAKEMIRASIEAALPVMFQPTYQLWLRSSGVWEDLDESVYLTLSEDNDEGAMKFRVSYVPKESK